MTESNATSQVDPTRARRRGNAALWISILCGTGCVAILVVVLLSVYSAEKKYAAGLRTIGGFQTEIAQLREQRESISGQIAQLNDEALAARTEAQASRAAATSLSQDAALRDAAVKAKFEAEADRRQIIGETMQLAKEIETLRGEHGDLTGKIRELVRSRDAEIRRAEKLLEDRTAVEAAIADAKMRQAEAKKRAVTAETDAKASQEQAETRNVELTKASTELARISAELKSAQSALTDEENRVFAVKGQTSKFAAEIQNQRDLLAKLRQQAADDRALAQTLRKEVEVLGDRRDEALAVERQIKAQTATLKFLTKRIFVSRKVLSGERAQARSAIEARGKHQGEQKTAEAELTDTKQRLDATRTEWTAISAKVDELTVLRNTLQKDVSGFKTQIGKLKAAEAELAALQKQLDATQTQRSVVSSEVAGLKTDRDALATEISGLRQKIDNMAAAKAELAALQRQMDAAQAQFSAISTETTGLKTARDALQKDVAALRQQIDDLETAAAELSALKRQLDATQTQKSAVSSEVAELTASRDKLQKDVAKLRDQFNRLEEKTSRVRDTAVPGTE